MFRAALLALPFLSVGLLQRTVQSAPVMKTLREDRFHFTYRYPAYLQEQPTQARMDAAAQQETDPGSRHRLSCMRYPLDGRHNTATERESILVYEADFGCMGKPINPDIMDQVVIANFTSSLRSYGGQPRVLAKTRYKLNGFDAEFVENSVDAPGIKPGATLYDGAACALMGQTAVCWSLNSVDRDKVHRMLFNPVEFDGKAAIPLVPQDILPR